MRWEPSTTLVLLAEHHGLRLTVSVVGSPRGVQWVVLAVESAVADEGQSLEQGLAQILDNHAHQSLGVFDELTNALARGEEYLAWWKKNRVAHVEPCACDAIAPLALATGRANVDLSPACGEPGEERSLAEHVAVR